jgi:hypothetical protein
MGGSRRGAGRREKPRLGRSLTLPGASPYLRRASSIVLVLVLDFDRCRSKAGYVG